MSEDEKAPSQLQPETEDEELQRVRALILQRRNSFVTAALASIGAAGSSAACGASVCLSIATQAPFAGTGQPPVGGMGTTGAGSGGVAAAAGSGGKPPAAGSGNVILIPAAGSGGVCSTAPVGGASGHVASAGSSGSAGTAGTPGAVCPPPRVCLSAYVPPASEQLDAGLPDPNDKS